MNGEVKPHFKDFFLYILIILAASLVVIFLFSKNYSSTIPNQDQLETTTATSSATPNITQPATKK